VTFAVGLVAGIVATVLVALLVFKARVIAGTAKTRLPDLRMAIAVAALIVAIVALVRSGQTSEARSTNPAPVDAIDSPSTSRAPSSSVSATGASSTTSTVFTTVTVPNVTGLSQSDAVTQLQRAGLRTQVRPLPLKSVPAGFVVEQNPIAFSTTTSGAVVVLGVSSAA
jgi:cytochrome bd-type quinol oxidase subunit 1